MKQIFIGLHTRNLGPIVREVKNPFTGLSLPVYRDIGMSVAESAASSRYLAEAGASEADPEGFRMVSFPGAYLHVNHQSVGTEIVVSRSVTPRVADFIFGLGVASGMVVISTIESDVAVLPAQYHSGIDDRWSRVVKVSSVSDLMSWIESEIATGRIASSEQGTGVVVQRTFTTEEAGS